MTRQTHKYRRSHTTKQGSGLRLGILLVLLMVVIVGITFLRKVPSSPPVTSYSGPEIITEYLPTGNGQVVHHRHFSLSYREDFEQAEWVAYELTVDELDAPRVPRYDWFNPDYNVTTRSAYHRDYTGSGYTRGHLAPAADMAFDTLAMRESFYMSNISPQVRAFNNGVWRELEEQTRDWARENKRLYIATGPVLSEKLDTRIGQNRIVVPEFFYKVLLAPDQGRMNAIAFIIPNTLSDHALLDYVVSIDSVEALTGIDFFPLLNDQIDERAVDPSSWDVDERRFQKRIREWNYQ